MDLVPQLDGTFNLRDVATAGPGRSGPLRAGVLYRSGMLSHVTDQGLGDIGRLGITDVIDLRSDAERARDGHDRVPTGVTVHNCGMDPEGVQGGPGSADTTQILAALAHADGGAGVARTVMTRVYRGFVTEPAARAATGRALEVLAKARGACLVHCSAGKDRTGWFTALVLEICGVSRGEIDADYLRSNEAAPALARLIPPIPGISTQDLGPVLGVDTSYLDAARAQMREDFGEMTRFLDEIGAQQAIREEILGRFGQKVP